MSPRQELAVGRQAYEEVLEKFKARILPPNSLHVLRAKKVVDRLAKAVQIEPLQREIKLRLGGYRFEWDVNVVNDEQVNAFCLPAGKMVVFTGLLRVTGESDDYLATVLSHEMAHALAHHASERVARAKTTNNILSSLSYNRLQEAEADHIGVFLMAFAGYDPLASVTFWKRMHNARGGKGERFELFSSHPSDAHRIQSLAEWAPQATKAYQAFRQGRIARPR